MSVTELVLIAAVVLIASVVQTTAGFGFSLTAVPMMALFTETRTASMLAAILSMVTSGFQSWHGRRVIEWTSVRRLCLAAGIGMPFGLVLFDLASEQVLRTFLGVTTLAMVVLLARGLDLTGELWDTAGESYQTVAGGLKWRADEHITLTARSSYAMYQLDLLNGRERDRVRVYGVGAE